MLRFSAKDLTPVLQEARKNHCGVVLVKDHGVYIMSEIGALTSRSRKVAYAKGCHPDKDEAWWEAARAEVGGESVSTLPPYAWLRCHSPPVDIFTSCQRLPCRFAA